MPRRPTQLGRNGQSHHRNATTCSLITSVHEFAPHTLQLGLHIGGQGRPLALHRRQVVRLFVSFRLVECQQHQVVHLRGYLGVPPAPEQVSAGSTQPDTAGVNNWSARTRHKSPRSCTGSPSLPGCSEVEPAGCFGCERDVISHI